MNGKLDTLTGPERPFRASVKVADGLGIDVELRSLEWGVYLDSTHKLDYDVARAGWVADGRAPRRGPRSGRAISPGPLLGTGRN